MFSPAFLGAGKKCLVIAVFLLWAINAAATTYNVSIDAMKFLPDHMEVTLGDRIVWENKDFFPHNVTDSGGEFHSPDIAPAKTWELVPKKKGTYQYICSLHPTMKATLIVK